MEKSVEVEVRGLLSLKQARSLEKFFVKRGKFKEKKERILIDYSLFLPNGGVRNRSLDIRLRVTNKKPEIVVKIGKWGANENRQEIVVPAEEGTFDKLVQVFGLIGLTKGALCERRSRVYEYRGIEFAIVEVPDHSMYFEAEKMVGRGKKYEIVHREINKICAELGLVPFDKEGFMNYIEKLNSEANEIFDFSNHCDNYFKRKYNL